MGGSFSLYLHFFFAGPFRIAVRAGGLVCGFKKTSFKSAGLGIRSRMVCTLYHDGAFLLAPVALQTLLPGWDAHGCLLSTTGSERPLALYLLRSETPRPCIC